MTSNKLALQNAVPAGQATLSPPTPLTGAIALTGTGPLPLIEDDEDLVRLLRQASNEELAPLVEYIVKKGGLTAQLPRTQAYRQHSPNCDHKMYVDDIAAEIQKFGANTFWSHLRRKGRGKKYRSILRKVAKRCGAKASYWDETAEIENRVSVAVLGKAYEKMTEGERRELLAALQIDELPGAGGPFSVGALQLAIQSAGFAPYKLAVVAANGMATALLNHGLAYATNAGLTKCIAVFAGPIGWALDAMWGGAILAGPAYRVTIPCVLQVAFIRQSMLREKREGKQRMVRVLGAVALVALGCLLVILAIRHFVR